MNDEIIEEVHPTDKLQLKSLIAFMAQLGFGYLRGQFVACDYTGTPIIKFATAVQLHNSEWVPVNEEGNVFAPMFMLLHHNEKSPFAFSGYDIRKAQANKIVKNVKLQANKQGRIICQSHKIEFSSPDNYYTFTDWDYK